MNVSRGFRSEILHLIDVLVAAASCGFRTATWGSRFMAFPAIHVERLFREGRSWPASDGYLESFDEADHFAMVEERKNNLKIPDYKSCVTRSRLLSITERGRFFQKIV